MLIKDCRTSLPKQSNPPNELSQQSTLNIINFYLDIFSKTIVPGNVIK